MTKIIFSQAKQISGSVKNTAGENLPNVEIKIKG